MSIQESLTKGIYCPRKLICLNPSAGGMALQLNCKLLFTYMAFAPAFFNSLLSSCSVYRKNVCFCFCFCFVLTNRHYDSDENINRFKNSNDKVLHLRQNGFQAIVLLHIFAYLSLKYKIKHNYGIVFHPDCCCLCMYTMRWGGWGHKQQESELRRLYVCMCVCACAL